MTDKEKSKQMLLTAKGQLDAVIRMLEDERYCIDVSNQILAVTNLLKKSNTLLLRDHMNSCVKDAFLRGEGEKHVEEMMAMFDKISK